MSKLLIQTTLVLTILANSGNAEDRPVDFQREIQPILQERCLTCHGQDAREGGLRFLTRQDLLTRNDSGEPAVIPGDSRQSSLIQRITSSEDRMPPEGEPLSDEQIGLLKRWIDQGAVWPDGPPAAQHWAYLPPQRPALPSAQDLWIQNPIDSFILSRLQREGLAPSPPAEPGRLLRRVYLDLIGIPPAVDELDAFLADPSPAHYEKIVDRLLNSPRYGEKWARSWLDLARYADSNGFQADQFRDIYAYRDWVIDALNQDMPFDQFTIEQIAGDLLPNATLEQKIATGFHRCTTCNVEAGVDPEENRTNQIIDRVNTTGIVWLGTTLECAQCHNHKYDPFTQQDYYQIFAFFNNTPLEVELASGVQYEVSGPKMELPLQGDPALQQERLQAQRTQLTQQVELRKQQLSSQQPAWEREFISSNPSPATWHSLEVIEFQSSDGAGHQLLDDGSILLTGTPPAKDEYSITFKTDLQKITGFKLEALTDPALPGNGPGRGDAARPNFVLYEFEIQAASSATPTDWTPIPLKNAVADFSQANWPVKGLIDGQPDTGWGINPQFGKPHWATFETLQPLEFPTPTLLKVRLPQHYGGARTLGRFRIQARTGSSNAQELSADVLASLNKPVDQRTSAEQATLQQLHQDSDQELGRLQAELAALEKSLNSISPSTTLVMVEMNEPRMTSIFKRGNFLDPLAPVEPGTPSALPPLQRTDPTSRPTRLDFARWLVSPENPLAARVTVNRWWAEFFGQGLVATLEDFGRQGEPATHPDLLDWLAVEFMDQGWSMKHLHKTIVLSATYQQDSRVSPEQFQQDPYNRLYARGSRIRLPAETIRDNALTISGLLSTKMGGPPVYPPQPENIWRHVGRNAPKYNTETDEDRFRRGIYVVWRRSAPYPSFVNFDAPDRGACVVNRSRTNTPLQALTLLNDPAYVEMAWALARQMATSDSSEDIRSRIEYGFRRCVSRTPASEETTLLLNLYQQELTRLEKSPELADQLVPESLKGQGIPSSELASLFAVANVLLNLDECITRN